MYILFLSMYVILALALELKIFDAVQMSVIRITARRKFSSLAQLKMIILRVIQY